MIRYTGRGDQCEVMVVLFGDGVSKSIAINLAQPPFNIKFTSNAPVVAAAYASTPTSASTGPPSETAAGSPSGQENIQSVEVAQGVLVMTFKNPLPPTNLDPSVSMAGVPRTRFDVYFIYEVPPIR